MWSTMSWMARITNGICTWCLGDAGPDHPDPCNRPALCLKCKRTGHVIKECRSACRDFHKPRQYKEKKVGSKQGGGRNKKDKRKEKGEDRKADNNVARLAQPRPPVPRPAGKPSTAAERDWFEDPAVNVMRLGPTSPGSWTSTPPL